MNRRSPHWKWALIVLVLVALLAVLGGIGAAKESGQDLSLLDEGRWYEPNRTRLEELIRNNRGPTDAKDKPFAVFDWDDTSVIHDTSINLFAYMLDHPAFQLTPDDFDQLVIKNLDSLTKPVKKDKRRGDANGNSTTIEDITDDLKADYRCMYEDHMAPRPITPYCQQDFKVKMLVMYWEADVKGTDALWWSMYFVQGMTKTDLQLTAFKAYNASLGAKLEKARLVSPEFPSQDQTFAANHPSIQKSHAGVMAAEYDAGLRTVPEIANLMHTLQANGIDVYVISGSMQDAVQVLATCQAFGYNLPKENVFGVRLATDGGTYQAELQKGWRLTVGPGKAWVIREQIHRGDPLLVGGDSNGDFNMMTEFAGLKAALLINRDDPGVNGDVWSWCMGMGFGKQCLPQGRSEPAGIWMPVQSSINIVP